MPFVAINSLRTSPRWLWLVDFFAGERRAWIFVGKWLLAIYLAAWLAMWLQLEQPATTMMTVAIVMHPQSGMVLAKSFYRVVGTLGGSLCGLLLLSMFPQQPELFLLSLSLWVALCAGGATLYRNFMSYGFVLAGYTAAIVSLPAINNPLGVFDSAVMRVSEVLLGIVVAAVVSDLIFPERLRLVLQQSARQQFAQFIDFIRNSTGASIPRGQMEQAHLDSVRAAVQLEDLRAMVIFEHPEVHARSTRMRLLNQRHMAASTSFQSLHHLVNRLQRAGRITVADALITLYRPIGIALTTEPIHLHDPAVLASRFAECNAKLSTRARTLRLSFVEPSAQLEFDTGTALVQRFAEELHGFIVTQNLLRDKQISGSVERVHFRRGNDWAGAAITVLRTFLTMTALSVFWIASNWNNGGSAMLLATIFSGLLAASPNPLAAATHIAQGYVFGILSASIVVFILLPGSEGFAMLIAASAGLLLIGPYLRTRSSLPGVGEGYMLGFLYMLALKNPMIYAPTHFFNEAIAQMVGLGLAGAAFMIMPTVTGTDWQRARQLRRLRGQVTLVATEPLLGLAYRFESVSRDLFQQIVTHTKAGSDESRDLIAWGLAVQESGRAMLELRQCLAAGVLAPAVSDAAQSALQAVANLYREPDTARWQEAERKVREAIMRVTDDQPVRLHLYQLLSALRDEESPLTSYIPTRETADAQ